MISILSILINLCLIVAIWALSRQLRDWEAHCEYLDAHNLEFNAKLNNLFNKLNGKIDKAYIETVIASKFAERAFNLASSANIGVVALQKSLATPRLLTKEQLTKNVLAKKEVDSLLTTQGQMDWLRPILSPEDLDLLDKAEDHQRKFAATNGGKETEA